MKASAALALFLGAIANSAAVEVPMSQVAVSGSGIASAAAPSSPAGRSVIPVLSLSLSLPTGFENKWRAQAFSGATCSGVSIFWIAPDGSTCTNLQGVNSLMVTNKGGCTSK